MDGNLTLHRLSVNCESNCTSDYALALSLSMIVKGNKKVPNNHQIFALPSHAGSGNESASSDNLVPELNPRLMS